MRKLTMLKIVVILTVVALSYKLGVGQGVNQHRASFKRLARIQHANTQLARREKGEYCNNNSLIKFIGKSLKNKINGTELWN